MRIRIYSSVDKVEHYQCECKENHAFCCRYDFTPLPLIQTLPIPAAQKEKGLKEVIKVAIISVLAYRVDGGGSITTTTKTLVFCTNLGV